MRWQRALSVWKYVGLFAIVVYFYSFGTFMSRMMALNRPTVDEDHVTGPVDASTRLFASIRNIDDHKRTQKPSRSLTVLGVSTQRLLQVPKSTLQVPKSTLQLPKSTLQSAVEIPAVLDTFMSHLSEMAQKAKSANNTLLISAESKSEVAAHKPEVVGVHDAFASDPEARLLHMFHLQKNATDPGKGSVDASLQHLNWTKTNSGNASGDHVVNPHPFKYLINTETICSNSDDSIFLIVYVHTAPDHYKRRMVIRQTWGDGKQYPYDVRVVFFTGSPASPGVQKAISFEAEQYGDIVQEDFVDSYKNLTYKGIAALKWIGAYCNRAKFVLKTDDDIFVNMFTLIRHLRRLQGQNNETTVQRLLMCLVWNRMPVLRSGKWMVSEKDWKDSFYPTYCSGSAFVMSTDVAVALHNVSYYVPFFWVDDMYITGLLPLKLGTIKHTQFMSTYILDGRTLDEKFTGSQWYKYIFCHVSDLNAILRVWKKVVGLYKGELVPTIQYLIPKRNSTIFRNNNTRS